MKLPPGQRLQVPVKELRNDYEWEVAKASLTLYWHALTQTWRGIVRQPAKPDLRFCGDDRDAIIGEMEAETKRPPPKIVGFDGARARFIHIYPSGFTNSAFEAGERGGKLGAGALLQPLLDDQLPYEAAVELLRGARKALDRGGQSPLHMTEGSDLDAVWRGDGGPLYVRGVRAWVAGDRQEAFRLIHRACRDCRASWPMFTLYPALLSPAKDAILRPAAAKTFALAVRSVFARLYDPQPSDSVYRAYLELLDETSGAVADLAPRDYIDLVSFVWVSTSYGADTKPRF